MAPRIPMEYWLVGFIENPSKVFLLPFLFFDWLSSSHLKSRIERDFGAFFGALFLVQLQKQQAIKDNFKRKYDGDLNCPFCRQIRENFKHIFQCNSGIFCRRSLRGTTLFELATMKDTQKPK